MWEKLKHEWKTLAWAVASIILEIEVYTDPTILDPWLDEQYRGLMHITIPVGFLLLRRWRDANPEPEDE